MMKNSVGHFFVLGFRGFTIPNWLREFEKSFGLGGVVLFDYNCQTRNYENNVQSSEQVRALCHEIGALASRPLVMVDQEGGKVRRLKEKLGFAPLPSHLAFNRLPLEERGRIAERSFAELRALGFHFNLAPVIDLNYNPANPDIGAVERSFSVEPNEVRTNVAIFDAAARKARLGLCLKHFPGLGGATVNSHEEITDLSDSIRDEQLALFFELGESIQGQAVLVSHGIVKQWEKEMPVSMSKTGVGRLRQRLPQALLISDDLQMQGLQRKFPSRVASELGLRAGLDMICIGNNLMPEDEHAFGFAEAIQKAVTDDRHFRAQAMESFERIQRTKKAFST